MPVTNYIWDVETDSYLMETDGSNVTQAVYTNEPVQFGNLVSQRRGSTTNYCHFDALGSTREVTGSAESITDTFTYDAWGIEVRRTGSTTVSFRWVGALGYYHDQETGSQYVRARSYQPVTARWLSLDPLGFAIDTNQYRYSSSDPVNLVDPSGLLCVYCDSIKYFAITLADIDPLTIPPHQFTDMAYRFVDNVNRAIPQLRWDRTGVTKGGYHYVRSRTGKTHFYAPLFFVVFYFCETQKGDCQVRLDETGTQQKIVTELYR